MIIMMVAEQAEGQVPMKRMEVRKNVDVLVLNFRWNRSQLGLGSWFLPQP